MTSPDNLRDKLIFYIGQESVAPGIRADKILALFNSKLDKIVSEIEGEKRGMVLQYNADDEPQRVVTENESGYNQALDTAISIIQNNKETK